MATFVPPPLSSREPDSTQPGFTPPPLTSREPESQSSAIGDFAKGVGSKLNPANILSGLEDTLKSIREQPLETAKEIFLHPYMAASRAKDAWDAGKPEEALAHVNSILDPPMSGLEQSRVKTATPGQRAEGLGEMVGTGIGAYLGAKAPDIASGAANLAGKAGGKVIDIASNPTVRDLAGLASPRASHALNLVNRFGSRLTGPPAEVPASPPPMPEAAPPPLPATDIDTSAVPVKHPPFAPDQPFSPSQAARQQTGAGTLAEVKPMTIADAQQQAEGMAKMLRAANIASSDMKTAPIEQWNGAAKMGGFGPVNREVMARTLKEMQRAERAAPFAQQLQQALQPPLLTNPEQP